MSLMQSSHAGTHLAAEGGDRRRARELQSGVNEVTFFQELVAQVTETELLRG